MANDRQWSVGSSNVFRVSRGARRGVSTRVRDDYFERRIERVSSTTDPCNRIDNRRIDRYHVSSIEHRVSISSTTDPCNRIDSRKATSLHEGAINRGQSKRQSTEGQVARHQQGQEARIAQAAQQVPTRARGSNQQGQAARKQQSLHEGATNRGASGSDHKGKWPE